MYAHTPVDAKRHKVQNKRIHKWSRLIIGIIPWAVVSEHDNNVTSIIHLPNDTLDVLFSNLFDSNLSMGVNPNLLLLNWLIGIDIFPQQLVSFFSTINYFIMLFGFFIFLEKILVYRQSIEINFKLENKHSEKTSKTIEI